MRHGALVLIAVTAVLALVACGDDGAGGGEADTVGADVVDVDSGGEDAVLDAETGGDSGAGDTEADSADSAAPDASDADADPVDAADAGDGTEDAGDSLDGGEDAGDALDAEDAGGGDASLPECTIDAECAQTGIVPPNACFVPRCLEGSCGMGAPDCDDGDPCTFDACDPHAGCVHVEQLVHRGPRRVRLCPGALTQSDAAAECSSRGEDPGLVGDADDVALFAQMLAEIGLETAWVSGASPEGCAADKRVVAPACRDLDGASGCVQTADCAEELPFFCEIACNDGDPCTNDVVGADGLCTTDGLGCDDGDPCTVDSCDERDGCVHVVPADLCDDGVACTTDACGPDGACTHTLVRTPWDGSHVLLACPGALTWSAARQRCAVEGAVLAMPTTAAHEASLAAIAGSQGATATLWAPLKQQDGGNQPWDWTDGGGSGTPPWCASVQPNFSEAGYCGAWSTADTCVVDVPCTEVRSFGCVVDTSVP